MRDSRSRHPVAGSPDIHRPWWCLARPVREAPRQRGLHPVTLLTPHPFQRARAPSRTFRMLSSIRTTAPLLSSTVFLLMGVGLLHTHIALVGKGLGFSVAMIGI